MTGAVDHLAAAVDDYLLAWVALSVGVGAAVPAATGLAPLTAPLLAVMTVAVDPRIVVGQLLAVVVPLVLGIAARARWPDRVGAHDDRYPSVSALALVLVIGIATAVAVRSVRWDAATLATVAAAAVALNAAGYALGWGAGAALGREERTASTLSVGMRDFAVAAALLVATGFPAAATLPAVVYGVVEMTTSAGLARWFRRTD